MTAYDNPFDDDDIVEGNEEEVTSLEPEEGIEEEKSKLYTEEEFNQRMDELLAKKITRREAKMKKEFESKLSKMDELESVLKAGLGSENLDEAIKDLKNYYSTNGIEIPNSVSAKYSERDERLLGKAEADEVISAGLDEVIDEVDRLATIGIDNMTTRERETFSKLAEYRKSQETLLKFKELGVDEKLLEDKSFKDFSSKFNPNTSADEIVDLYQKKYGKEIKPEQIGSLTSPPSVKIKDYYTPEEVDRLTMEDLDNPQIMAAVDRSMQKWRG